jgi:hypothetical protein
LHCLCGTDPLAFAAGAQAGQAALGATRPKGFAGFQGTTFADSKLTPRSDSGLPSSRSSI